MTVVVDTTTAPLSSRSTSRSKANGMRFSSSRLRHGGLSGGLGTSTHSTLGINN